VVAFTDGRKVSATIVGEDSVRDVAAIKVKLTGLHPVTFGSSANVKLAEWAIVIGSPLNFQNSVTLGIVSGINRTLDLGGGQSLTGLLQVDAAISPGNSGGGCFDAEGNFIGMPELQASAQSGAENLGFAIPSDVVKQVAHTLTGK
jgi:S1-C subfamily serine protease